MGAPTADSSRRKFVADFLKASLVFGLCLLWVFHAPLLSGQVEALQARPGPPEALSSFSEMVYEVQSALWVQARMIKRGFFPAWSPYSQGGTPLIGKMQNGVFAPHHLPLYVFPEAWTPFLFMLVLALKYYLAFAFAYLYARSLQLDLFGGVFSGLFFVFSQIAHGQLFSWGGSGLYLPLLLLLVEMYFRDARKPAQFLLPWAVAFPFLSGHFESAFYASAVTGIYFLAHLWNEKPQPPGVKFNSLVRFIGLMLIGAAIASPQIVPAVEYVGQSYNKIWHTAKWFSFWEYETIGKHLSGEDAPLLIAGMGSLLAFAAVLRRCLCSQNHPFAAGEAARKLAASLLLAFAVACLARLGLDDSLKPLSLYGHPDDFFNWLTGLLLLLFSFWGWRQENQPYGIRILGIILIGSIIISLKTPPFSNIILHLPIFGNFHNTSNRWEFRLILGILCASAFQTLSQRGREDRLKAALNVFSIVCVLLFGFLGAQPIKTALARTVSTGLPPLSQDQDPGEGGFMGPERQTTYRRRQTFAGWVAAFPQVASISIGVAQGGQILSNVDATTGASMSGGRLYFNAEVDLPPAPNHVLILARIKRVNGSDKILRGAELDIGARGGGPMSSWWLIAGLLAAPLLFLCGPSLLNAFSILMLGFVMWQYQSQAIPADQIPYRLAGIDKIKEDPELFRISSLQYNFLQADYPNVYGLSDLRTGGDNLDVLPMIYFSHLYSHFLGQTQNPSAMDAGLRLLGLANVKYLIGPPDAGIAHPSLEPYYRGADMSVFKNKNLLPRAAFYSLYAYLPLGDWRDWSARDKFLGPIAGLLAQKSLDEKKTLLLNDPPSPDFRPAPEAGPEKSLVGVESYSPGEVRLSVEADRPGFVFLSDNYFPGWTARLNGKKTRILRSWLTFRAVEVPAGKSSLVFSYRPLTLWASVLVSAAAIAAWVLLYLRHRRGRRRMSAAAERPLPQKKKKAQPEEGSETLSACGAMAERILLLLIGASILFWSFWSLFVYHGETSVRAAACVLLAGLSFLVFADFKSTPPAEPLP